MKYFECLDKILDADRCNFEGLLNVGRRNYKFRGDGRPRDSSKNFKQHIRHVESYNLIPFYDEEDFVIYVGYDGKSLIADEYMVTFDLEHKNPPWTRPGEVQFQRMWIPHKLENIYKFIRKETKQ